MALGKMVAVVGLLVFVSTASAREAQIVWVKLTKKFSYKDIDRFCTTDKALAQPRMFFGAEVESGIVKAAVLKTDTFEPLVKRIVFQPQELSGVQIKSLSPGNYWVESLTLTARLLNWVFFNEGGLDECYPTQQLVTLSPNTFQFTFDFSLGLSLPVSLPSNTGKYWGKRKDGRAYQAALSFDQSAK